ncbi:MAG: hypothetical protein QXT74_00915 [Candidatus Nezhaarchaeales archaeon]
MSAEVGLRGLVETTRGLFKMYFSMVRAAIDMTRVGMDSYLSLCETFLRQLLPSEGYESIRRTVSTFIESQDKLLESFKKLLDAFEEQQSSVFDRVAELIGITPKKERPSA